MRLALSPGLYAPPVLTPPLDGALFLITPGTVLRGQTRVRTS